jgi:hypothetical protein
MATSAADRMPPSSLVRDPFAPGAEVEVLFDDEFHGHWRVATVVRFVPARRRDTRSAPDRYEVSFPHLAEGGRGRRRRPARNRVRPRPPRPVPAPPPWSFLLHDAVEAFCKNAWRAGLVVSASPSAVTVAFPVTREAIECPPGFLRPRLVYVDGDWVPPSRAATMDQAQAHLRPANVYKVGDKVEVVVSKGMMWVSATVARVVDDLSYVVEYDDDDLDLEDEAATEYLHCKFIRPAVERLPLEMFQLDPGATVEALCDGAWLPAAVRRVVGEGEFEVSIHGNEAKPLVTDKVRPQYNWDGEQWTIVTPMVIKQVRIIPASLLLSGLADESGDP